jgi:hypothetical protein
MCSVTFEEVYGQFVIYSEVNKRLKYIGKEAGFVAKSCHMNCSTAVYFIVALHS